MMKKTASLILALCLLCLPVSVPAENADQPVIPQNYEDLPAAAAVQEVSGFFGTWQTLYAVYDGEVHSLEDAAVSFGGSLPILVIDEETVSASVGEGEEAVAESLGYAFDAEFSQITVADPDSGEPGLVIGMLEDGTIEAMFIQDETAISLFMVRVDAGTEG